MSYEAIPAEPGDIGDWLDLAREVEPLFGPMADDPAFHDGMVQAMTMGRAWCVKRFGRLAGGLVLCPDTREILWFAVSKDCRGKGVGRILLDQAVRVLGPEDEMTVTTFEKNVKEGLAARNLYESLGFRDLSPAGLNPAGIPIVRMARPGDGAVTDGSR